MGDISFRVLKDLRCVHFVGTGNISFDYLIDSIKDVHTHPDFDFTFSTFIDFENAVVSFFEDGLEKYRSFFQDLQKSGIRRQWAIYSKQDLTFKSANMTHMVDSNEIKVDVFSIRNQALQFLGLSAVDLETAS